MLKVKISKYFFILYICIVPLLANCIEEQRIQKNTMKAMKENSLLDYAIERDSLTLDQIYAILDQGTD